MSTSVIQNSELALGEMMRTELNGADKFCAASAFLNSGGLDAVFPAIEGILEGEGEVSIVHGADFRITDPKAIARLVVLKDRYARMTYKVQLGWDLTRSHRFHPKLYFWTADYVSYTSVVGSSNLPFGGLFSNTEVKTVIRGLATDRPIEQCISIFGSLVSRADSIEPDYKFLAKYQELYDHAADAPLGSVLEGDMQALYSELAELIRLPIDDWQPATQLE